jgi:septum formation protein
MIILASGSASRRAMLEAAGVAFTAVPPDLDERALEASLQGAAPPAIALALAEAKAQAVAAERPDALVLGSDSLVVVDGQRFDKPASRQAAEAHLCQFSGRTMELHSAAALVRGGAVVWRHAAVARLQVRPLTDAFINHYLDREWPAIGGCVGAFRIEGPGVQLFDSVDGDHFTILGMPLLPVLGALREQGVLPA